MEMMRSIPGFGGTQPLDSAPKEVVKAAKKEITEVVEHSFETLQGEAAKVHADILKGTDVDAGHLIHQLKTKLDGAKNQLEDLKKRYSREDSGQVHELLVKGELQVVQLEQSIKALQVLDSKEGKKVLEAKKIVSGLLNEALKKPKEAISLLIQAQKALGRCRGTGRRFVKTGDRVLQKRLGYQAKTQLALKGSLIGVSEKSLLKSYTEGKCQPLKSPSKRDLEKYQSIVSKAYALRFITGYEGTHEEWTTIQRLGKIR